MKHLALFLVVLFALSAASAESLHHVKWLEVETTITNPVSFTKTQNYQFDGLTINFTYIPMTSYRQSIEELYLSQQGFLSDSNYVIQISEPEDFTVEIKTITNTTSKPIKVDSKVPFPIQTLSQELYEYTRPTELIDINDDIRRKAAQIASDSDDLYRVVFDIATWVNTNIEYNLSTLTAQATLPSSWVLDERRGVCDEISNLFISMLRSLGIPARYVSGMSYTDSELFEENWGAHGWAEVYFPGFGWIPFDPTYNQLGFVDATHIKFNHGIDNTRYANTFSWRARNLEVLPGALNFQTEILSQGPTREDDVSIDVRFESGEIGFNSYNIVHATITNKRPYYVARSFNTALVRELSLLSDSRVDVLLEPFEQKEISWLVYVGELDTSFIYTFPTTVYSNMGERTSSGFTVTQTGMILSNTYIFASKDDSEVDFFCDIISSGYVFDTAKAVCEVDLPFDDTASICFENYCNEFELYEGSNEVEFDVNLSIGHKTYVFTFEGYDSAVSFVPFNAIDNATIRVVVDGFKRVSNYSGQRFDVILTRDSFAIPLNVQVTFGNNLHRQFYRIDNLHSSNTLPIGLPKNYFTLRNSDLKLVVTFTDIHGTQYEIIEELSFQVTNITIFDRAKLLVNSINSFVVSVFN